MPDSTLHSNKEQTKVIQYSGREPLLVVAGPGSGKTTTILNRLKALLNSNKYHAERMVIITYTRSAAAELNHRFLAICKKENLEFKGFFGTFHSFFYQILTHCGAIKPNCFMESKDKTQIFYQACTRYMSDLSKDSVLLQNLKRNSNEILRMFSNYKNTLDENSFAASTEYSQDEIKKLFSLYEKIRLTSGNYDYDDLQWDCYRLFKQNPAIRQTWSDYLDLLFVDEFQDINPIQYQLLLLLYRKDMSLTVVGDDDQSIYSFRGAKPYWMQKYVSDFGAQQIALKKNYRCCNEIIACAASLISNNKSRIEKEFLCGRPTMEGRLMVKEYSNPGEQFYQIGLQALESTGTKAILFRTNASLQKAAILLKRRGFFIESKELKEDYSFIEEDLYHYFNYIFNQDTNSLNVILNKPLRYVSRENRIQLKGKSLDEMMNYCFSMGKTKAYQSLKQMSIQCSTAKKLSLLPCFIYICKVIGYEKYLERKAEEKPEVLDAYREILGALKGEFCSYNTVQSLLLNYNPITKSKGSVPKEKSRDCIKLLTLHASKGLEFDNVWIPDCNEGLIPYGTVLNPAITQEIIEEERRILYVGITRAKKYLELSCITPTKESPRPVSRFLKEIEHKK